MKSKIFMLFMHS